MKILNEIRLKTALRQSYNQLKEQVEMNVMDDAAISTIFIVRQIVRVEFQNRIKRQMVDQLYQAN